MEVNKLIISCKQEYEKEETIRSQLTVGIYKKKMSSNSNIIIDLNIPYI